MFCSHAAGACEKEMVPKSYSFRKLNRVELNVGLFAYLVRLIFPTKLEQVVSTHTLILFCVLRAGSGGGSVQHCSGAHGNRLQTGLQFLAYLRIVSRATVKAPFRRRRKYWAKLFYTLGSAKEASSCSSPKASRNFEEKRNKLACDNNKIRLHEGDDRLLRPYFCVRFTWEEIDA